MKKNLITKTLFLAMGLCVASGITATIVSTNKSAVAVHAAEPIVVYIEGEPGYDVVDDETWVGITGNDNHGYVFIIEETTLVTGKTYKFSDMAGPYRCELSGDAQEQATDATFLLKDNGNIEASMTTSTGTYLIKTASSVKVSDVLPNNFPATKEKGWTNDNGSYIYCDSTNFYVDNGDHLLTLDKAAVLTSSSTNYVYYYDSYTAFYFNMEDGEMTSFFVSCPTSSSFYGTYVAPVLTYTITATVNDEQMGSVDPATITNLYNGAPYYVLENILFGDEDAIIATAKEGYEFDCWKIGEVEVTSGTITEDMAFTAVFKEKAPAVGDKFSDNGINYVITAVGDTNTVKVGDNTAYEGTSVTIPATVTYNSVTFDVTEISDWAFYSCKITEVKIPASVTTIGEAVFRETLLTEIEIPACITSIGELAFWGCQSLANVMFAENSELTTIGRMAFYNTVITEIEIPAGVVTIGESAFYKTKITEIKIPAGVVTIGESTFSTCEQLTTVTFAENSALKTIGNGSFKKTKITEIEIPAGVETIGARAFSTCEQLTTVTFAENSALTTIGENAFEYSAITEIEIPVGVTNIGEGAFMGCPNLTTVTFAKNSQLETIGKWAFDECGLVGIELPASIKSIAQEVFWGCADLTTVKILATEVPTTGEDIFDNCDNLETIYVPASSFEAYQTAWADYASKIKALHVHAIKEIHFKVDSTCLEAGHKAYYECDCGKYFSDEALTQEITNLDAWLAEDGDGYIAPKGHSFGGEVTYTWNDETHECTASWKCQHTGCNETQTETVTGVYVKDFDATCTANEKGHYEATFTTVQEFEKQITSMFDVPNTAKGHNYGTPIYTWNEDHTKCTATATCSHGDSTITNEGTVTVENGYAVATFENQIFETQRFKLPEPTPSNDGLSGGAIAGIAVGSVVVVGLGVFSIIWFGIKKKSFADLIGIFKK